MAKRKIEADPDQQGIEQLQQRYNALHTKKIQAETNLENARQQLERLKSEAREKFGTDDVAQLREKLDAMKAENQRKRENYQAELDRIETELTAVEAKYAPTEEGPANREENA
jgi:hypothetical protein